MCRVVHFQQQKCLNWQIRGGFLLPPNEQRVRGVTPRNCGEKFFERGLAQTIVRFW